MNESGGLVMAGPVVSAREARYQSLAAEWRAIVKRPAPSEARFVVLKAEADALLDAGRWSSGPADLLTVLGRAGDELFHSRMLAWLMTPSGRHGLRRAFLLAFLEQLWPREALFATGPVTVSTEVARSDEDDAGNRHEARADIEILGDGATVVIENKVGAGEQALQCERQYWAWRQLPDPRWIYLTPRGEPPASAASPAAQAAWRTRTYRDVRRALARALDETSDAPLHTGRSTAIQYLATLDAHAIFTGRRR